MKIRPQIQFRFKNEAQYQSVKERAESAGISLNEYIVRALEPVPNIVWSDGVDRNTAKVPIEKQEVEPEEPNFSDEFAEYEEPEIQNPCPDCGAELGWNEKRKIYECKCGFIKKGRK